MSLKLAVLACCSQSCCSSMFAATPKATARELIGEQPLCANFTIPTSVRTSRTLWLPADAKHTVRFAESGQMISVVLFSGHTLRGFFSRWMRGGSRQTRHRCKASEPAYNCRKLVERILIVRLGKLHRSIGFEVENCYSVLPLLYACHIEWLACSVWLIWQALYNRRQSCSALHWLEKKTAFARVSYALLSGQCEHWNVRITLTRVASVAESFRSEQLAFDQKLQFRTLVARGTSQ